MKINEDKIKNEKNIKNQKDNDSLELNEPDKNKKKYSEENVDLKNQIIKEKDRFIRLFAEFDNYKKRIQKEKLNFFINANENLIMDLLPILDDFERAVKDLSLSEGIMLIKDKFYNTLKDKGLKKISIEKGDIFNTDIHEAITQISVSEENIHLTGKIVEIIEAGYILGDKVIRHAKVVIGK